MEVCQHVRVWIVWSSKCHPTYSSFQYMIKKNDLSTIVWHFSIQIIEYHEQVFFLNLFGPWLGTFATPGIFKNMFLYISIFSRFCKYFHIFIHFLYIYIYIHIYIYYISHIIYHISLYIYIYIIYILVDLWLILDWF